MPPLSRFKKKYRLEPTDFPKNRPVICVIERFDSVEDEDQDGNPYVKHMVYFVGYRYPLNLNNQKVDAIQESLGVTNTEDCIGKKIAVQAVMDTLFGKKALVLKVLDEPVSTAAPTPVPYELATTGQLALQAAADAGVKLLPASDPGSQTFAGASNAPRLTGATEPEKPVTLSGETLGLVQALRASQGLYRRNKSIAEAQVFVADRAPHLAKLTRGVPLTLWPKEAGPFVTLLINTVSPTRDCDAHRVQELENELKQSEADFAADASSLDKLPENDDDIPI